MGASEHGVSASVVDTAFFRGSATRVMHGECRRLVGATSVTLARGNCVPIAHRWLLAENKCRKLCQKLNTCAPTGTLAIADTGTRVVIVGVQLVAKVN